jgi:hypothetical protein
MITFSRAWSAEGRRGRRPSGGAVVDAEALTFEQSAPDGCGAAPGVRHALVFHDQATVALALSRSLHLGDRGSAIDRVDDGFALADAVGRDPAAVVLVGYRRGSTAAAEATGLLLGLFPDAWVIGFRETDCAPLLVAAVTGGVRGSCCGARSSRSRGRRPRPGVCRRSTARSRRRR